MNLLQIITSENITPVDRELVQSALFACSDAGPHASADHVLQAYRLCRHCAQHCASLDVRQRLELSSRADDFFAEFTRMRPSHAARALAQTGDDAGAGDQSAAVGLVPEPTLDDVSYAHPTAGYVETR